MRAPLPKGFWIPKLTYDGSTNPKDHIALYKIQMQTNRASYEGKCRCLPTAFTGSVLKGSTITLRTRYILESIDHGVCDSVIHFERHLSWGELADIRQRGETLKNYCRMFNDIIAKIKGMSHESKMIVITSGLWRNTLFWNDLIK